MFANYPDVLTVEDATNLLGFKSQTGVIRRIHQNRIRYLKVGRNFMIPKEYLIDKQYDPENFAAYPAGFSGPFFAYCSVRTQNSISGAFNLFSNHAFQFLRDRCTICNTVIPEIRNTFALFHGQIAVDQKQAF